MLIPFLVIVSILGYQFHTLNEANGQTLEQQFNACLTKATGECPTIEDVRNEKLDALDEEITPVVVEEVTPACTPKPYSERRWHWECSTEVMPYSSFVDHGPGHDDDVNATRPQGKLEKPDRGRKGKRGKKGKKGKNRSKRY